MTATSDRDTVGRDPAGRAATPATIEDVARRADVSLATVSRALRGLPNVAPATRERVLAAASELHYIADPYASRLATGRSHTIGLVVPLLGRWYYAKVFSGVEQALIPAGYEVLPFALSEPEGRTGFLRDLPFRKRVDGLIVADAPFDDRQLARLRDAGVELVTLGVRSEVAPSVTIDNADAARAAVGHLLELGHRRIAIIGTVVPEPTAAVARHWGYHRALLDAGCHPDPALAIDADFSLEGGARSMRCLLDLDEPPTAVFACSDELAIGAMQVAWSSGLAIPGDLSVVGFDDHDVAEVVGLTTVRQDVVGHGRRAARMLLDLLAGELPGSTTEVLPTRLVVRATTGAA